MTRPDNRVNEAIKLLNKNERFGLESSPENYKEIHETIKILHNFIINYQHLEEV